MGIIEECFISLPWLASRTSIKTLVQWTRALILYIAERIGTVHYSTVNTG